MLPSFGITPAFRTTPAFWNKQSGLLARLLAPLGFLYGRVTAWRMMRPGTALDIPVICIGNFTVGGTGKTPVTAHVVSLLSGMGEKPFILSRGYGGKLAGPVLVDTARHSSADCGDEPLLLSRRAPTIVAADRLAGARLARSLGATVLVMDDGLQNPSLQKDISLAVVDAGVGFGNGYCLPAGPLRAPVALQLPLVDAVLAIGSDADIGSKTFQNDLQNKPLLRARLRASAEAVSGLANRPLLAFCGIGRPEKFFETLRHEKLDLRETKAFPDHHAFTSAEMNALQASARDRGLTLVTTEKDSVRLADLANIHVVPVQLETSEALLPDLLQKAISRKRSGSAAPSGA